MPTTTTMFSATTPENTHLAYHASTSTNPNPVISPAFVEANYETLESLLRDRQRQMRNNDLQTELEYFREDYDKEREMEPRPEPARAVTPPLRAASPRVRRRRERVVWFEETQNRGEIRVEKSNKGRRPSEEASRGNGIQNVNLPPLLAAHLRRRENEQPLQSSLTSAYGGTRSLVKHLSTNLPPTYKGLMEKTYTWVEAREVATNGVLNDRRDSFERPRKSSWNNNKGQMDRSQSFPYKGESHKLLSNLVKSPREILATERVEKAVKTGQLTHLVKGVTKKREKTSDTQSGEKKKEGKWQG
ncbi:hypothetical protein Tco_0214310 [Tanacetum coccineum]